MKRRPLAAGLTVAAALTVGLALVPQAANAAASDCPVGYACIWGDSMYKTSGVDTDFVKFANGIPDYGGWWYNAAHTKNAGGTATSIKDAGSRTDCIVRWYTKKNYQSAGADYFDVQKGEQDGYIVDAVGAVPGGFNDKIWSGQFICL
ncbi:hypothetical protein ET475_10840 [Microbacterium protaetiae]|uniref:Peptidase inhibitor family I36 protein n=1 Tax=Microbacterium protaetiae TaxID=2509458 RepID=A0A4P6EE63_9MICO|nr:hypothetical protein [Microbacterium protaetiae]QAY60434.1 hypothetical protein ET475_10840 [Microbacterium protaetiae]